MLICMLGPPAASAAAETVATKPITSLDRRRRSFGGDGNHPRHVLVHVEAPSHRVLRIAQLARVHVHSVHAGGCRCRHRLLLLRHREGQ